MTEIEMQKKSRASHNWTEAESLILPTRSVSIADAVIRLEQLHKNLSRKQTFLNDLNLQIQSKFDNEEVLETDMLQSEEFDDKLVQQLDQIDRFIKSITPAVCGTTTSSTITRSTPH